MIILNNTICSWNISIFGLLEETGDVPLVAVFEMLSFHQLKVCSSLEIKTKLHYLPE